MVKISEKLIEKQILTWLKLNKFYSFKNYDQAAFRNGSYIKDPFQKRGISDITILMTNRVIFLEVKRPGGIQSEFQKKFEHEVKELGHEYYLVYSLEEVKKILKAS